MNVKEYLKQYEEAERKVRELETEYKEELEKIDIIRSPSNTDGTPHGSGIGRSTEQKAVDLLSKAERLYDARMEAIQIRQEIYETVSKVPGDEGTVLYLRYIKLYKWEYIAESMHYSVRNVHLIHQKALRSAEDCIVLHTF